MGAFTLGSLLDRPWAQVGAVPSPPLYKLVFFLIAHIYGGSAFPVLLLVVDFHGILPTRALVPSATLWVFLSISILSKFLLGNVGNEFRKSTRLLFCTASTDGGVERHLYDVKTILKFVFRSSPMR